ncbi:hypothetical protein V6N13_130529 [Hibiscus sabdariffa]|uniref:Uncharacterized protein n=1 Tax=Hibiscus sabdariffa TaxID=183260 RepID=A0ABR2B6B5_9ROSI
MKSQQPSPLCLLDPMGLWTKEVGSVLTEPVHQSKPLTRPSSQVARTNPVGPTEESKRASLSEPKFGS